MSRVVGHALVAAALLSVSACSPDDPPREPATPLEIVLGDVRELPVSARPTAFFATVGGLILTAAEGDRERVLTSTDEGVTWTVRAELPLAARVWAMHETCSAPHRIDVTDDGLFYIDGLDDASPRARIADAADVALYCLVAGSDRRLGAAWIASGRGWPELMFSQSVDHGSTWSPPVRVNTESRRKEVSRPVLVQRRGGWVLIWTENRDARTLFDIYGSSSADGRTWSPSHRLNDDAEPAFNVDPFAVEDERGVHVLAQDYRDLNRFGDRDGNIYYARLAEVPAQRMPNVRVNDVTNGPQSGAALARDADTGSLVAAWLDARNRLTADIYASASRDGASWGPNRRVNVNARPEGTDRPWMATRPGGGVYVGWMQSHGGTTSGRMRRITAGPASAGAQQDAPLPPTLAGPLIDPIPPRRLVAQARFEGDSGAVIETIAGSWIVRDGALLTFGYSPTFAKWAVPSLSDFVLEGRFRLDRSQHMAAHLYLRARVMPDAPDVVEGFELRNHFRMGVFLSHTRAITGRGARKPGGGGEPLTDRWFSLRQDTWYEFRVVVVGRRLDYWLDGEWMLSHDALAPGAGAIVLGADGRAPVEWDDLRLYSFDSSQVASSR